jgi:maltose-binding protein MalE
MSGNVVNYTAAVLPQSHADTTTTTTTETTTESETEAPEKLLRGDVDVNGTVQIADAVLLARYLAEDQVEVTVTGLRNAELDGDDSGLTAADLGTLLQILAGSIRE